METNSTEDSYADRRKVFKNIWETALVMEEKDADTINKTKVIKTQRLDDDDKIIIGKRKKERIRNLRAVCNRILDYCDRQDVDDDLFYEQLIGPDPILPHSKPVKLKTHRRKKKIIKAKNSFKSASHVSADARAAPVQPIIKADVLTKNVDNNLSGIKFNRASLCRRAAKNKSVVKSNLTPATTNDMSSKTEGLRRKVFRKKRTKKKKTSPDSSAEAELAGPPGDAARPIPVDKTLVQPESALREQIVT